MARSLKATRPRKSAGDQWAEASGSESAQSNHVLAYSKALGRPKRSKRLGRWSPWDGPPTYAKARGL